MLLIFFFLSFFSLPFFSAANMSPSEIAQRVNAHLLIADYQMACQEALTALQQAPQSKLIWLTYLRCLAKAGEEKAMMAQWKIFIEKFPEERKNREVLEHLAWAVIHKGATSSSPPIRVIAMLGAFFSQDVKGISLLLGGLQDDNSFLRAAAVKLSSHLMDASLQEELFKLLQTEKSWNVRLEVIHALGKLRVIEAKHQLKKIIAHDFSHQEEKEAAIQALVKLSEGITPLQISQLVSSEHSGMRMLACEQVAFFDQTEDIDKLMPLIEDYHADVRAKILQTIGRLRITSIGGKSVIHIAEKAIHDQLHLSML